MKPIKVSVTTLSQHVRLACDRYVKFRVAPQYDKAMQEQFGITIQPLTPLLESEGATFEERVEAILGKVGETVVRPMCLRRLRQLVPKKRVELEGRER
jgi:hypothetical protein